MKCQITYSFRKTLENTYEGVQYSEVAALQPAALLKINSFIDMKQEFRRRIPNYLLHSFNLFDKCRQLFISKQLDYPINWMHLDRRVVHRVTTSDNDWQRVVQRVTTNDNEWQRMTASGTSSDNKWCNEWQRVIGNDNDWYNEWQRMSTSDHSS